MSYIKLFLISLLCLSLSACQKPRGDDELYLGTIAGPETSLVKVAKTVALKRYNLKIKIVEFEDYQIPNLALDDGSIDANMFQHQPFLDLVLSKKGYQITPIGRMFIYPMAAYSKKHQSLVDIPENAIVAIPNDPSNGARALRLLARGGLITIPDLDDMKLSPRSIIKNPKNLRIRPMGAAQLPRVLKEVDLAVINTNFAIPAGLKANKDALLMESKDSPYANIVTVRTSDKDHPKYKKLMKALHSQEVINKADELFKGQAIKAW